MKLYAITFNPEGLGLTPYLRVRQPRSDNPKVVLECVTNCDDLGSIGKIRTVEIGLDNALQESLDQGKLRYGELQVLVDDLSGERSYKLLRDSNQKAVVSLRLSLVRRDRWGVVCLPNAEITVVSGQGLPLVSSAASLASGASPTFQDWQDGIIQLAYGARLLVSVSFGSSKTSTWMIVVDDQGIVSLTSLQEEVTDAPKPQVPDDPARCQLDCSTQVLLTPRDEQISLGYEPNRFNYPS